MRDSPNPNLDYTTDTKNQFLARTVDDCTWYSSMDAFEQVSHGSSGRANPEVIRKKYTGTISGPSRLRTVLELLSKEWPDDCMWIQSPFDVHLTIDHAVAYLQLGASIVVLGDYENLPAYYRRWTHNDRFRHAVKCTEFNPDIRQFKGSRGATWWYDPLGGGVNNATYNGEWIAVEYLFNDFAWHTGTTVSMGIVGIKTEETMFSVKDEQTAPREVTVKAGALLMREPSAGGIIAKTVKNEQDLLYLGPVNADWHTVISHVDGQQSFKGVYVHKKYVKTIKDIPPVLQDPELVKKVAGQTAQIATLTESNAALTTRVNTANGRLTSIDKQAVPV